MSCRQTAVKGGQRVVANNGRACSARGLPGDEVRLEDEAEHDALAEVGGACLEQGEGKKESEGGEAV